MKIRLVGAEFEW